MLTELCILTPMAILYMANVISLNTIVIFILLVYWLPKFIFINTLERLCPSVLTRNVHSQSVALTFDDMPYGSHETIISTLDKHNMKGTFFIISGDITEANINIFVNAVKSGHQLANHGKTNSMHFLKDKNELTKEIMHCDTMIKDIYKIASIPLPSKMLYRPGCGVFGPEMLKLVTDLGYQLALGSTYPNDPMIRSSWINYWYIVNHIEKGDIVIMHDRSWTPDMLDNLLIWMNWQEMKSVTVEKL